MFRRALALSDLRRGEMAACVVDGIHILLARTDDGNVHAYEDRCAHLGVRLSEGVFEAGVITCHAHHFQYDAATGCGINPRRVCLKSFAAEVAGSDVRVDVGQILAGGP